MEVVNQDRRKLFDVSAYHAYGTTRCELDSHADTCAFGNGCHILHVHSKTVSVSGFHHDLPAMNNISIVDVAVAYDCPYSLTTFILIFHQVFFIPGMHHHLLNPDQMRENGVIVNDNPLICIHETQRKATDHCIYDPATNVRIPMKYLKPISYFEVRKPTQKEALDDTNHVHVILTSPLEWNPYDTQIARNEVVLRERMEREYHSLRQVHLSHFVPSNSSFPSPELRSISVAYDEYSFYVALGDSILHQHAASDLSRSMSQMTSSSRRYEVTPEKLAMRWRCSVEVARRTLETTTQRAVHDFTNIIGGRKLRATQYQLKYPRLSRELYCDVWYGPCKSLEGNTCAVVYAASCQWSRVFPIKKRDEVHLSLDQLFRAIGFPEAIVPDYAKELTKGKFLSKAQQAQVAIHPVEPYMHNLRPAEDCIRELVRLYSRAMVSMNVPAPLWDRCMVWVSEIRSHMNLGHLEQNGQVGTTVITGNTSDVSHLVSFTFYEWIWYHTPQDTGEKTRMALGKWCGPSFDVGDILCYAVLNSKGSILHKTSVFPLKPEEERSEQIKRMKDEWEAELKAKLGDRIKGISDTSGVDGEGFERPNWDPEIPEFQEYEDDVAPVLDTGVEVNNSSNEGQVDPDNPADLNKWISARIRTMRGDEPAIGTVKNRKRGPDGKFIGTWNSNPLLDTSVYLIEFDDGSIEEYMANQIAEEVFMSVDDEGFLTAELKEIVDHKKDGSAVYGDDAWVRIRGKKFRRQTTKGWHLLVQWKSGETSWETLKDMKEAYPVKVAEYAVAKKLVFEPAFQWWVPVVMKKKDRILKVLKKRMVRRKNEKYGIEVPKPMDVKRALEIDCETGTDHWYKAMVKEVGTVLPALKVLETGEVVPVGSQYVDLMIIFDVKMDLTRKCRIVARGDQVETPSNLTYASVVSRDSIRIALLISALNGLTLLSADVAGAYLNAPCRERVHTTLGPEFGQYEGATAVIVKSLYGLNSGGFSWRSYCADILRSQLDWK